MSYYPSYVLHWSRPDDSQPYGHNFNMGGGGWGKLTGVAIGASNLPANKEIACPTTTSPSNSTDDSENQLLQFTL